MFKAPVLRRLPKTIGALPLMCIAPPAVTVLCASILKAELAPSFTPLTVPFKLMAPPVMEELPASPRIKMPMALSAAESTDSPRTVTAPVPALIVASSKATPPE